MEKEKTHPEERAPEDKISVIITEDVLLAWVNALGTSMTNEAAVGINVPRAASKSMMEAIALALGPGEA